MLNKIYDAIHMLFSCRVIKHIFIIITITLYIYFIITEIPHFKPMKNKIKKTKFPFPSTHQPNHTRFGRVDCYKPPKKNIKQSYSYNFD